MDVSSEYIEQCEKAEEIQELWIPKLGDWCRSFQGIVELVTKSKDEVDTPSSQSKPEYLTIGTTFGKGGEATGEKIKWNGHISLRQYIWLPRQDQLQTLSGLSWYLFDKTCVTWATTNSDYQRESKEIVGLRVVMKLNYKKQWLDNDWKLDTLS